MKSIAVLALAAVFSFTSLASARSVNAPAKNANDRSVEAVAGPPPAKKVASAEDKTPTHPGKKMLKKSKLTMPPAAHNPY